MQRNLENRLARAEATASATSWTDLQSAHHRCLLRVRVKICESVREYLTANSDEPERHALWRHGEEASAELANIPDTPELRAADEAILSRAHDNFRLSPGQKGSTASLARHQRVTRAPPILLRLRAYDPKSGS